MAGHGGARNRSGPHPSMVSARSDARDLKAKRLDAGGYQEKIPDFPLAAQTVREAEVWEWAWRTPQATQWIQEPWRWYTIGQWVRWSVKAEAADAPAATVTSATRFADQIGLTPAGLKENGWIIGPVEGVVEPSGAPEPTRTPRKSARRSGPQRRLSPVPDVG
ncbi:hypothetical protein E7742_11205 [Rhodococcus sp. SGAir0479]|nr:hypothetical protein E7742_11205 [Rhodococcus sp. SGAir0479]